MNEQGATSQKPVGIREWYDFVGQLADVLPGIHLGGQEATRTLLAMLQLDEASRVLDVGCGPGTTACLLAQHYGSRVQGIDISEVMIARAEARARQQGLADRVEFRLADVFDLPFEDDLYDVAIIESVLTTLPGDKGEALREVVRVVRPGGRIGVNESTVDPSTPPEMLALFAEHPAFYGHFTTERLRRLLEEAGLQVLQVTETQVADVPSAAKGIGLGALLSFMVRVYPKILIKLIRDARFRKASRIDDQVTKRGKQYMGYSLIVGLKPA